jgi:hypothetical protein
MTRLAAAFVLLLGLLLPAAAQTGLPMEKGLPVLVKAAVGYVEVTEFDENRATFSGTVDIRLRWQDLRLRRPAAEAANPPRVLRGDAATAELARIWTPSGTIVNQVGAVALAATGLRIFPDGTVELMRRYTGTFATEYDVSRFPFGAQKLKVDFAADRETANQVLIEFDQDDLDFSRPSADTSLDGWTLRSVDLQVRPTPGWYGAAFGGITSSLEIARVQGPLIASIFIPLLASLIIPFLAIWLNRVEDGVFLLETHETVNIIIGGLFAVIALNFTVNSVYDVLESGDNPINRLFALNYLTLAVALAVNILIFRFHLVERVAGRYVQEQLFLTIIWAVPLLALITAASVILVALM